MKEGKKEETWSWGQQADIKIKKGFWLLKCHSVVQQYLSKQWQQLPLLSLSSITFPLHFSFFSSIFPAVFYSFHPFLTFTTLLYIKLKPADSCLFNIDCWQVWVHEFVCWSRRTINQMAITSQTVVVTKYHVWCSSSTKLLAIKLIVWSTNVVHRTTFSDVCTCHPHGMST